VTEMNVSQLAVTLPVAESCRREATHQRSNCRVEVDCELQHQGPCKTAAGLQSGELLPGVAHCTSPLRDLQGCHMQNNKCECDSICA